MLSEGGCEGEGEKVGYKEAPESYTEFENRKYLEALHQSLLINLDSKVLICSSWFLEV